MKPDSTIRVRTWLVGAVVVSLLHLLSAALAGASGDAGPLTVVTVVDIPSETDVKEILLVGLAGDSGGAPNALGLRLVEETVGWFPQWKVELTATPGRLPASLVDRREAGAEGIVLGSRPESITGRRLEARLSYDLDGRVSVRIQDLRSGEVWVETQVYGVDTTGLYLPEGASQGLPDAGLPYAQVRAVEPVYAAEGLPLALGRGFTWELVQWDGEEVRAKTGFQFRSEEIPGLRIRWPQEKVPGEVHISAHPKQRSEAEDLAEPLAVVTWSPEETVVLLPLDRLPLGDSTLHLTYVDPVGTYPIGTSDLRRLAAVVYVTWEAAGRVPGEGVRLRATVWADQPLEDLPLEIRGRFTPSGDETGNGAVDFSDLAVVDVPSDSAVSVLFQIPLPPVAGTVAYEGAVPRPDVYVRGEAQVLTLSAPPPIWAAPVHESLEAVIGRPAVVLPGERFPDLSVRTVRSGVLSVTLVRDAAGSSESEVLRDLGEYPLGAGETRRVAVEGIVPASGHYEFRLKFVMEDGEEVYDALHFTAVAPGDVPPGYSRIVFPGPDGKLRYVTDFRGNRIPDFSHAGYMGGGAPIPDVPVKVVVEPGPGDDTRRIQEAIDTVSRLPRDASGFRGAILLRRGTYEIEGTLRISESGVVLRGEGKGEDGTVLIATATVARPLIEVAGLRGISTQERSAQAITDLYVPVGARTFHVRDATGLKEGDPIVIRRFGNAEWIHEIGMDRIPERENTRQWEPFSLDFERIITAVRGNEVTVDAPVVNAIEAEWGGGIVIPYTDYRIEQVGIENLRAVSRYDETLVCSGRETHGCDDAHATHLAALDNVKHAWIRDVTTVYFAHGVTTLLRGAKWVTVQDSESLKPVSTLTGGNRYPFVTSGQFTLFQRNFSDGARHAFAIDSRVAGPNVFRDSDSTRNYATSEPHHRWSVGGLFDNVKAPIAIQDRGYFGTGHGWAGANYVAWNTEGTLVVQQPPTAQNWAIGHVGPVGEAAFGPRPDGYWESHGQHVLPGSLYLRQLEDRLGPDAALAQVRH